MQTAAVKENNQEMGVIAGSHPLKPISAWKLLVAIVMDNGV